MIPDLAALKYKLLFLMLFSFSIQVYAQHPPVFEGMTIDTTYIVLNDLRVNLVRYGYGKPNINFLAIHDDEDTGIKAAFEYIRFNGGKVIDSQYGDVRNFKFNYWEKEYQTDPNSIYTPAGIKIGLEKYGNFNDEVSKQLERASKVILNLYHAHNKPDYMFTLHNNADGGFGISSYLKGYDLESAADSVYINSEMDADDLVLVTELALFNGLKAEKVNVVLQSREAPDDGSLSIYAMHQKIPYINVEVQHGHQEEHLRLIEIAVKVLKETYPDLKGNAPK
ncbi:hypothetical protein [Pedobacter metabolipauper]|nr:hypothetical protein [Pedobacter metabolipauper]